MAGASEFSTALYVARQPILDEQGRVFGYELLYRGAAGETVCSIESDLASARVITNAVFDLGLETLTAGRLAFLNVTSSILDTIDVLVSPDRVVLELLESIEVTDELLDICKTLRARGFRLALDDFVPGSAAEALLPYASFVKVDVLAMPIESVITLSERLRPSGVVMLAEKVESLEVHHRTRDAGYRLFQGYYFCRPVTQTGTAIPPQKMVYLRLLAALNKPNLTTVELEGLVKQDVSLSVRVLRFVNSAAVPTRAEIGSIRQALFLIGMDPVRKWASVWCLAGLSAGATPELPTLALVRARSCELVGEHMNGVDTSEFFLVGLCSLLDVMLGRTMPEALSELPLSTAASEALLGHHNRARGVLDAVTAFERGNWDEALAAATRSGVAPTQLAAAYTSALKWAQDIAGTLIT